MASFAFPAIAAFHHPLFVGQAFSTAPRDVVLNLLMLGSKVNGVTWTLPWELLASFYVLPLIHFFRRSGVGWSAAVLVALLAFDIAKAPLFNVFTYSYAFGLGAFLAIHGRSVNPYGWPSFIVLACAVDLCLAGTSNTAEHIIRFVQTLCAGGIVLGLYHRPPIGGRLGRLLTMLGEAAYPFYLSHRYILHLCGIGWLVVVGSAVNVSAAQLAVFVISVAATLPPALWLHARFEVPILGVVKCRATPLPAQG